MFTQPYYFVNFEQDFAHWENDLNEEKCALSSINAENFFDQLES